MNRRWHLLLFPILCFLAFSSAVDALAPPHDSTANPPIDCSDCHAGHGMMLIPRGAEQEAQCKSCHNPTGQASSKIYVSNHGNGTSVHADCGCCHDPHSPDDSFDEHTGQTAQNLKLFRANTSKYISQALEPAVFHERPADLAFDDNNPPWNGACQTCHTNTTHHTSTSTGDHLHHMADDCITCHPHKNGFMPIGECTDCHGQPPDGDTAPNRAGAHAAHMSLARGPMITTCTTCHAAVSEATHMNGRVSFASGTDVNGDGDIELYEADVCNGCHSPGGAYNGVDDPDIGARYNWLNGVYDGNDFQSGKEKWCAGCHDDDAPAIGGVTAPNITGNETVRTFYGYGYGFYQTGHGLSECYRYPASEAPGAGLDCLDCHDITHSHIDGNQRTYEAVLDNYQTGYRLKDVGGNPPLVIPRPGSGINPDDFALCIQCHDPDPLTDSSDMSTNFRDDPENRNDHYTHLYSHLTSWDSDWDGETDDTRMSCPACHNVHGSPSPRMIRHGELISLDCEKVPALDFQYLPAETFPTLPDSSGGKDRFIEPGPGIVAKNGVCRMCHNDGEWYDRTPVDQHDPGMTFVHGRAGSDVLTVRFTEGVYSQPDGTGALDTTDFVLTDNDDGRSIIAVIHTAGDPYAEVILDAPLDGNDDVGIDTLAPAPGTVFDATGRPAPSDTITIEEETDPPALFIGAPSHQTADVPIDANLIFNLREPSCGSGIDISSLTIYLTGSLGYNQTYTDSDTSIVTITGIPSDYGITVNPDTYFNRNEIITVTVTARDFADNSLTTSPWSFTTASTPPWRTPEAITDTLYFETAGALIDDDPATGNGFGAGGPDHVVTFELARDGTSYSVARVRLYGSADYTATWQLFTSIDGIIFTSAGSWQVGGQDQWYDYTLPSLTSARFIRINDRHGGPETKDLVFEFDFMGSPE